MHLRSYRNACTISDIRVLFSLLCTIAILFYFFLFAICAGVNYYQIKSNNILPSTYMKENWCFTVSCKEPRWLVNMLHPNIDFREQKSKGKVEVHICLCNQCTSDYIFISFHIFINIIHSGFSVLFVHIYPVWSFVCRHYRSLMSILNDEMEMIPYTTIEV